MKIGITCYPTYGGSGIVASELGKELSLRGHEVHFICYEMPVRLHDARIGGYFHQVNVSAYPLFSYPPYCLALAAKMAEVASYERLQVLHVHYAIPHAVSAQLARQLVEEANLKVVTTLHGTDITLVGQDSSFLPVTKLGIDKSDAVTAVSTYLKERTELAIGTTKPIEVVYNFVNPDNTRRMPKTVTRKARGKVVIHISNFRPVKRIGDVVAVFARIRKEMESTLLLVGDGPERARAEQMSRELGILDSVRFLGSRTPVEELLSSSDLMLFPSEQESFGLAALEAMACEVPVIGTNTGGLPEVVVDGESGLLFEVGDVESMAAGAIELLRDEEKSIEMGRRGRERVVENFSSSKIIPRYEAVYERVLNA
jgi:N-acetyl-alpha-D-glucosaminyl L-malate synthase BshA